MAAPHGKNCQPRAALTATALPQPYLTHIWSTRGPY
jgi:hypothetical protein